MKRDLTNFSISKIYIFLGIVGVTGIFLLFFIPQKAPVVSEKRVNRDLINQVLHAASSVLHGAWTTPSVYLSKEDCHLPGEVGNSYLECSAEGWQCLWNKVPHLDVEYAGRKYQLKSSGKTSFIRREVQGIETKTGYITEVEIPELDITQKVFLPKTCHEMYLPQRSYAYGEVSDPRDLGIIWDNAGKLIFIDKFYVPERDVKEWKEFLGEEYVTQTPWKPAKLQESEQIRFCQFHGKKRLMAHFFDASQMSPVDLKTPFPHTIVRPDTPWQRDYNRTFLASSVKEEGFKPSQKDCRLAQVGGCPESYFMSDSVSWMGVAFGLGFEEELFYNPFQPELNLKKSSRLLPASSHWHKLGRREKSEEDAAYAFRCYREIL